MTKTDIINTAFKVWGQDFYRTTSLSQISSALEVSKTALYRHFKDKDALLEEMYIAYFDEFSLYIKESYQKAIKCTDSMESCLTMMRTFAEFYLLNGEKFLFSLIQVYNRKESDKINKEFLERGIDIKLLSYGKDTNKVFPSKFHLIMVTLIFWIAQYHQQNSERNCPPSREEVKKTIDEIEVYIVKGLGLDSNTADDIDFKKLEDQVKNSNTNEDNDNSLLTAVMAAVAEAGPWNVSMEMVARHSGLSKSGLYAHFFNKQDMLEKLFLSEFTVIISKAKEQIETSLIPEEQLYLGIISIANHLRTHPEFLMSLEWLKTRKSFLLKLALDKLQELIGNIQLEHIIKQDQQYLITIAQWILFMIVSTLAWWPYIHNRIITDNNGSTILLSDTWKEIVREIPNDTFRTLFRFIAFGTEGLN